MMPRRPAAINNRYLVFYAELCMWRIQIPPTVAAARRPVVHAHTGMAAPAAGPSRISKRRKRQQLLREREKALREEKMERRRVGKVSKLPRPPEMPHGLGQTMPCEHSRPGEDKCTGRKL